MATKQLIESVVKYSILFRDRTIEIMTIFAVAVQVIAKKIRIKVILVWKYSRGWVRLRDFHIDLIQDFAQQHHEITHLVETGDVKHNDKDRQKYESCKAKISVILRARRRIHPKNKISNRSALVYLNNQLSNALRKQKYETADA